MAEKGLVIVDKVIKEELDGTYDSDKKMWVIPQDILNE
jgi:hypothetical protein